MEIPNYDYFGLTKGQKSDWDKILKDSQSQTQEIKDAIKEIDEWAQITFQSFEIFI